MALEGRTDEERDALAAWAVDRQALDRRIILELAEQVDAAADHDTLQTHLLTSGRLALIDPDRRVTLALEEPRGLVQYRVDGPDALTTLWRDGHIVTEEISAPPDDVIGGN